MNDDERSQWVDNDEGLYGWWKKSKLPKRIFVIANRAELDDLINQRLGKESS